MTIINNIEIDDIVYNRNIIKEAINNNDPIEDKLHVILIISNPCLYARRYILIKEFITRINLEEENVILYVVELAYKNQRFSITNKKNKRHLQIRTEIPLWHKENMINLGVKHLLPKNWKAFAWIDSDIDFENTSWALDTLKVLNGTKDIIQLYSQCLDLDENENTMKIFSSFGFMYSKNREYATGKNYWHPGYAWACTRKAYEKMGGLFDKGILGSGDNIMSLCLINKGIYSINEKSSNDYKNTIIKFQNKVKSLRLGYIPGVIRHYFHGSKKNRHYSERWKILISYDYRPSLHIKYDINGILIPTEKCPKGLINDIYLYFKSRNEDEFYTINKSSSNIFLQSIIKNEELVEFNILLNNKNQSDSCNNEIVDEIVDEFSEEEYIEEEMDNNDDENDSNNSNDENNINKCQCVIY
jgi:hypothetical protein